MSLVERQNIEKMRENGDVQGVIEKLRNSEDVYIRFAASKAIGLMGDPVAVPSLLECAYTRSHKDVYVWYSAKQALVLIGTEAVEQLIEALSHNDWEIRDFAAEALGKIGDTRAVDPLITITRSYASFKALGLIGDLRAVDPLIEILNARETDVRRDAAKALGELGDKRALAQLKSLLDEDGENRIVFQKAIENINDPYTKIHRERRILIREIGANALKYHHVPAKNPIFFLKNRSNKWQKVLIKAISDSDPHVCKTAIMALVRIGEPVIEPVLTTLIKNHKPSAIATFVFMGPEEAGQLLRTGISLKNSAINDKAFAAYHDWENGMKLLGCIGTPAVEPLLDLLKSDEESIQYMAIRALGEIGEFTGDVRAVGLLLDAMNSSNYHIRSRAARALGYIGDIKGVDPLIKALNDENKLHVCSAAVGALGRICHSKAVDPLISLLGDDDLYGGVNESLCNIGPPAVENLIAVLESDDIDVRKRAIWCLGNIKDRRVVEPLLAALNDKSISKFAAEALSRMRNPYATEPLLDALLIEKKKKIRKIIAFALDGTGWRPDKSKAGAIYWIAKNLCDRCVEIGEPAVEILIPVLKDRDMSMRISAASALEKIGDPRAIKPLIQAMEGKNEFVQKAAAKALDVLGWKPEKPKHIEIMKYYLTLEKEVPPDVDEGVYLLTKGITIDLEGKDPREADKYFEQAAGKCRLSKEYVNDLIVVEDYDYIAIGHLWCGYALLNLGIYNESYRLLTQVIPYLNKYKQTGNEMWRKVEYALPKALVPLCEYKIEPTQVNLQKAMEGIEAYIQSLHDARDKQEGQNFYDHLKTKFADVYSGEAVVVSTITTQKSKKADVILDILPGEYETSGCVIIFDRDGSGSLEVFGTNKELDKYVEKVKSLGNYPTLSGIMELYVTESLQEPDPLIEECEIMLSRPDIETEMKEKTKLILNVARDAKEAGSTVMLYFDPEVE